MEYYSAIIVVRWMKIEYVIYTEVRKEKNKYVRKKKYIKRIYGI